MSHCTKWLPLKELTQHRGSLFESPDLCPQGLAVNLEMVSDVLAFSVLNCNPSALHREDVKPAFICQWPLMRVAKACLPPSAALGFIALFVEDNEYLVLSGATDEAG